VKDTEIGGVSLGYSTKEEILISITDWSKYHNFLVERHTVKPRYLELNGTKETSRYLRSQNIEG
jgi:hypothetical protein